MKSKIKILVGSKSDLDIIGEQLKKFKGFNIIDSVTVISAHRNLDELRVMINADESQRSIYICCAGLAAHLAGVTSALSNSPVLGVPINSGSLSALPNDSLLSTLQMPKGTPVATFGVNNITNAILFALRMQLSSGCITIEEYKSIMKNFEKKVSVEVGY